MSDESDRPQAAGWEAQRAAVAKRNLAVRKRGEAERRSRERVVETRKRALAAREAQELEALNAQIARRRVDG